MFVIETEKQQHKKDVFFSQVGKGSVPLFVFSIRLETKDCKSRIFYDTEDEMEGAGWIGDISCKFERG